MVAAGMAASARSSQNLQRYQHAASCAMAAHQHFETALIHPAFVFSKASRRQLKTHSGPAEGISLRHCQKTISPPEQGSFHLSLCPASRHRRECFSEPWLHLPIEHG